jgi:hypothetical protein
VSAAHPLPLPDPPRGFRYYRTRQEVLRERELFAYQHMLLRAWVDMDLSGVLTLDGIPTVYVKDTDKPLGVEEAARIQGQFWNQGIATVLLLRDPHRARVFSSMTPPANPATASDADVDHRLVETINLATQATWETDAEKFYLRIATGAFYREHETKYDPEQTVDAYLLENLGAVRDELVRQGLKLQFAHAFLGRLLFTCYLCDRGIVKLADHFPGKAWQHLHELLAAVDDPATALYDTLFPVLKHDFNSSMFDDDLDAERARLQPRHFKVVQRFLQGDEIAQGRGQHSLGFWAYDFKFIPVETISAIYENFLEGEDGKGKHASGAFYTPRFLAEMTLDLALEGVSPIYTKDRRYLDPSCGSGIFLVLLFNRLAAEWCAAQRGKVTPQAKADALLERLDSLRGVDKHPTACRIACFSLYLAFLDQFDPPGIKQYKLQSNRKKLPNLLRPSDAKRAPEHPVVWEGDFFDLAPKWRGQFDLVVGNPPWAKRDTENAAHFQFMKRTPEVLKPGGHACLILPSKVFLNQTDAFQSHWLKTVTLEKVFQLADYRKILFKEARCPCNIVLFTPQPPDVATHEIEYTAPKVSLTDLRDGVIPVAPQDRKWIPLQQIIAATEQKASTVAWKSRLWGTARDLKFLDYLFTFPRLGERVDLLSKTKQKRTKPWAAGQGCKPWKKGSKSGPDRELKSLGNWKFGDAFLTARLLDGLVSVPPSLCPTLKQHFEAEGYVAGKLYSRPDDALFSPPLVLFNQGFSDFGFFDSVIRFQDALQSIAGPEQDTVQLQFLAAYLRSKLARYFIFQTASNIATERDKAHLFEVLRLPFFLPDSEAAPPNATEIVAKTAAKIRRHIAEMEASAETLLKKLKKPKFGVLFGDDENEGTAEEERNMWFEREREKTARLQREIDPLFYDYFGLNEQERALVEVTCDIFDKSDTPGSLAAARAVPTQEPLDAAGLEPYATMLADTLNGWATGSLRVSVTGGVDGETSLGLVELTQTRAPQPFHTRNVSKPLAAAMQRLQEASKDKTGRLVFRRDGWFFDGTRIVIAKPALLGQWTRTAALNDAAEIHAHIAEARRQAKAQ